MSTACIALAMPDALLTLSRHSRDPFWVAACLYVILNLKVLLVFSVFVLWAGSKTKTSPPLFLSPPRWMESCYAGYAHCPINGSYRRPKSSANTWAVLLGPACKKRNSTVGSAVAATITGNLHELFLLCRVSLPLGWENGALLLHAP